MLKHLEEYGKFLEISGFKKAEVGDAKAFLESVGKDLPVGVEVQLFNADLVATWQHLYFAAINALMAFKNQRNISKSLAVETLLYASAQRQIKKALDLIGLKPVSADAAVLVIGNNADSVKAGLATVAKWLSAQPDESVLDLSSVKTGQIRQAFDVSEVELEATSAKGNMEQALVDVVIERGALLSTRL
jgi:KEOPS complex subunit Cgi121